MTTSAPINDELETNRKAAEIFRHIVKRVHELGDTPGEQETEKNPLRYLVAFGEDWGGNSLTVFDGQYGRFSVGDDDDDYPFAKLIDEMHGLLVEGLWATGVNQNNPEMKTQYCWPGGAVRGTTGRRTITATAPSGQHYSASFKCRRRRTSRV